MGSTALAACTSNNANATAGGDTESSQPTTNDPTSEASTSTPDSTASAAEANQTTTAGEKIPVVGDTKEVEGVTYVWTEAQGLGFYMPTDFVVDGSVKPDPTWNYWTDGKGVQIGVDHEAPEYIPKLQQEDATGYVKVMGIPGATKAVRSVSLPGTTELSSGATLSNSYPQYVIYALESGAEEYTYINVIGNGEAQTDAVMAYGQNLDVRVIN